MSRRAYLTLLSLAAALLGATAAHAEPYLAVANGYKCGQCHVNPTGGGERTVFGEIFSQTVLPARHIDTGTDPWTGQLNRYISIGGDLRYDFTVQQVPNTLTTNQFDLQQARVYLAASVIPDRLLVYVDEQVAPGGALNREAWGMFWWDDHTSYVKSWPDVPALRTAAAGSDRVHPADHQHQHDHPRPGARSGLGKRPLGCAARREQRHRRRRHDQQR